MTNHLDVSSGQLVTVRLYGKLGARFGRSYRLAVSSAGEAVRALSSQLPGFESFLTRSKDMGLAYTVFYGKRNLTEEQLRDAVDVDEDIRIAPVVIGSKNGGWLNIILGAVLIVVGLVLSPFTGGASLFLVKMGTGLIVSGIVQLLTPVPKDNTSKEKAENQPSYAFNGPINTQAQGGCVPVLYGEMIVGSAVVSAGITAVDQAYVPSPVAGNGSGGRGGNGSSPWHQDWAAIISGED